MRGYRNFEDALMKNDSRFRRSFFMVAAIHIALILGVLYCMKRPIKRMNESVTWMEPGSFSSSGSLEASHEAPSGTDEKKEEHLASQEPSEIKVTAPPPEPVIASSQVPSPSESASAPSSEVMPPQPANTCSPEIRPPEPEKKPLPEPPSEIKVPKPPQALPKEPSKISPSQKPSLAPKPTPKPVVSKPTLKTLPKPTPKPKPKPTEEEREESSAPVPKPLSKAPAKLQKKTTSSSSKKEEMTSSSKKKIEEKNQHLGHGEGSSNDAAKKAFLAAKQGTGSSSGSHGSGSGHGEGGVNSAALGAYHELIHDRFYSQWDQPTSIPLEHKHDFVCTLRLTIEQDGTISHFMLAKPSGNPVMDQSVLAAAAKVTKIAPLPQGLGSGGAYTVNINFELE